MSKRLTDDERCSMLYWFPLIEGKVPTPKTVFVPLPKDVEAWMDSGIPKEFIEKLKDTAAPLGYPVFMRTDQLAAKHSWIETCYVARPDLIGGNCYRLIEENLMADFLGNMIPKAMVLREFLTLDAPFKAFKDMPIAREYRIFAEDGKVLCLHPYWPPESIEFWNPEDKVKVREMLDKGASLEEALKYRSEPLGWREQLAEISKFPNDPRIEAIARIASKEVGGYWSVDVCRVKDNGYYLTDMAVGERSYHWEGCPKARKAKVP
jgi:hypothetical protein